MQPLPSLDCSPLEKQTLGELICSFYTVILQTIYMYNFICSVILVLQHGIISQIHGYLDLLVQIWYQSINYYINGIQLDWHHPMSPMVLTTLERSSRSLMLEQELLAIHEPGIATPTLVVQCGRVLVGVHCQQFATGMQLERNCSSVVLLEPLFCIVVPHTSVLMENTAV